MDRDILDKTTVAIQREHRVLLNCRVDDNADVERLVDARLGWGFDIENANLGHLVVVAELDEVDRDAITRGYGRRFHRVAGGFVAIGKYHDPSGFAVGKTRTGEPDRTGKVGCRPVDFAQNLTEFSSATRSRIDHRLTTKCDDPRDLVCAQLPQRVIHEFLGPLLLFVWDGVRSIEEKHRGEP